MSVYKRAFAWFCPKIGATECPFECGGPMAIWAMPKWTAIFLCWGFPYSSSSSSCTFSFSSFLSCFSLFSLLAAVQYSHCCVAQIFIKSSSPSSLSGKISVTLPRLYYTVHSKSPNRESISHCSEGLPLPTRVQLRRHLSDDLWSNIALLFMNPHWPRYHRSNCPLSPCKVPRLTLKVLRVTWLLDFNDGT